MEKRLGKISKVSFGFGGYDGAMLGLSVVLDMGGTGVSDFKGHWATRPDSAEWSAADGTEAMAETMYYLRDLLTAAKKLTVDQLKGVPVEVTLRGTVLKSWRILTEVL